MNEQSNDQMRDLAEAIIEALTVPGPANSADRLAAEDLMRARAATVRGTLRAITKDELPLWAAVEALRGGVAQEPVSYEPYVDPASEVAPAVGVDVMPAAWHAVGAA